MMTALAVVAAVLSVSGLIVLHEAGHMWVARRMGMRVERFSVGFGPVLWAARRGETEYALSALPLGGYVRIAGMATGDAVAPDDRGAYCNQPAWRRVLVLAAGPGANYLAAVALAAALLATVGLPAPDPSARVGDLVAGMPAERAGLRPGDRILAVAGAPVATWDELVAALQRHPGERIALAVERGDGPGEAPRTVLVTPVDDGGVGRIGFRQHAVAIRRGPAAALLEGLRLTDERAASSLAALGQVVRRRQRAELAGPVGIAQELVRGARIGADRFFTVVWNVSIALALLNLLPLPALDGGRLVFLGYELVTRRRVDARVESIVHGVGFAALLLLLLGVTIFGDLARLLHR